MKQPEGTAVLTLDEDQQTAYRADHNAAVTAGAGSGKTTVLAERYVRLVTEGGMDVSSVLTLTFSQKAAAEMYIRIYRKLSESGHPRAREQLALFDRAKISTLDSFCVNIVRGSSYRFGIAPDFTIDERALTKLAERSAVDTVMSHRRAASIRRLVASRNFDDVVNKLFIPLALRAVSLTETPDFSGQIRKQIKFLRDELRHACTELNALAESVLAIDDSACGGKTMAQAKASAGCYFPLRWEQADTEPESMLGAASALEGAEAFKKPSNASSPALRELKELIDPIRREAKKLKTILANLCFRRDMEELGAVFDEYAGIFRERKRQGKTLSFRDTAELAVAILKEDRALRDYYKNEIKAIMIDEFQDNNLLQKELLFLLAERPDRSNEGIPGPEELCPDKLFFVGDEKQSIYRFRGADVSVFRTLAAELARGENREDGAASPTAEAGKMSSISLGTNYRSSPSLVRFFNTLFPGVFGRGEEAFEAEYHPMQAPPGREDSGKDGAVEFYLVESKSRDNNDESAAPTAHTALVEAIWAAERIIRGVKAGEFELSDAAILFRTTTHQDKYERVFRRIGIPFTAADPRGIYAEGPANDFYAMLRLVLFPRDRNAYAAVLRSPFVRIGDETLLRIMLENPDEPFPEEAPDHWFSSEAEKNRFFHGAALCRALAEQTGTGSIAAALSYLWYESGYRTFILGDEKSRSGAGHFEFLYSLALDADRRKINISAFLDELAPLMGSTKRMEGGDPVLEKGKVSFLTIHKSKGLEFPVVILANAWAEKDVEKNRELFYMDKEFGAAVNLRGDSLSAPGKIDNYFFARAKEHEEKQSRAELKRLLYVGATRAEQRLIIFGTRPPPGDGDSGTADSGTAESLEAVLRTRRSSGAKISFMDLIASGFEAAGETDRGLCALFPVPRLNSEEARRRILELKQDFSPFLAAPHGQPAPSADRQLEEFYERPFRPQYRKRVLKINPSAMGEGRSGGDAGSGARTLPDFSSDPYLSSDKLRMAFGTLCHRAIEDTLLGTSRPLPGDIRKLFGEAGISPKNQASIYAEARSLAEKFSGTELGRAVLAAERRKTEFPFLLPLKEAAAEGGEQIIMVNGIMDLVFEHQGNCVILDFKTDRHLDPSLHQIQMDTYRAAAAAFSDLPVKTVLVYLRSMEAVPVEAVYDTPRLCGIARAALEEQHDNT